MTDAFMAKASYGQVFAQPRFRVLFAARALGVMSDTLRSVALSMLVFSRTNSPLLAAVAFTMGFLPQAIGGIFLGAVADRYSSRALIVAGYVSQCVVGLLLAYGRFPVSVSLILVAAAACFTPISTGAATRFLAEILQGDAYVLGRSLSYLVAVAAQLAGLAGGGALTVWLGAVNTMLVTVALHLIAALIIRLFLTRTSTVRPGRAHDSIVRKSWQGTTLLMTTPGVRKLVLVQCLPAAYPAAAESLLIPYAAERQFSPEQAGFLLACLPVGMLLSDIAVGRMLAPVTRERLVFPLLLILGLPWTVLALTVPFSIVATAFAVSGAGSAYLLGLQRRFLLAVPAELQGQGFALLSTASMTAQGVGPMVFGTFAEFLPVGLTMSLTGVFSLLTTLLLRNSVLAPTGPGYRHGS